MSRRKLPLAAPPSRVCTAPAAFAFALALTVLGPPEAHAQIVNVQPIFAKASNQGFGGTIEGSLDWRSGNTRLLIMSGSALVHYRIDQSLFFLMVRGDFARSAGGEFVRRHFEHLRYRVTVAGPLEAEMFAQYQEDVIRRVAVRALFGVGPRLHVVNLPWLEVAFGAIAMLEYEQLGSGPQADAGEQRYDVRLSTYSLVSVRPSEKLKIAQTMYLQPRVDQLRNVRVLHELESTATVTKYLSFKMSLASMYDSRPPISVAPLDTTLKSSVMITF